MADEFDLKPTSRGEEFLDVILRSLGGDTPDIPQPAWRYEEYLAAIANAIQNGGGGGSSGGGVLVVNTTFTETGAVCDKTAAEMMAAAQTGLVIIKFGPDVYTVIHARLEDGYYTFYAYDNGEMPFEAESGTDYPTFIPE